jgi:hypothetical protein
MSKFLFYFNMHFNIILAYMVRCLDGSVGIAMSYKSGAGAILPGKARDFSLLHSVQTDYGAHSTSYAMGTGGGLSPGVKRISHEAHHSPPSSAEVKNRGAIPPLSHTSSWHSA